MKPGLDPAVKIYKSLGEPSRLSIVRLVSRHKELSCMEIRETFPDIANSTLSHHLKQLKDSGVLEERKEGTYHYHSINRELLGRYAPFILEQQQ